MKMNIEALQMAYKHEAEKLSDKVVLYTISMLADDIGACVVSHERIALAAGVTRESTTKALGRLKRAGVLTTEHTPHHHGVRQPDTIFLENFRGAK